MARLMAQVKLAKPQGDYLVFPKKIQNTQLLILDDFGLTAIDQMQRWTLLDIVEQEIRLCFNYFYFSNIGKRMARIDRGRHHCQCNTGSDCLLIA